MNEYIKEEDIVGRVLQNTSNLSHLFIVNNISCYEKGYTITTGKGTSSERNVQFTEKELLRLLCGITIRSWRFYDSEA